MKYNIYKNTIKLISKVELIKFYNLYFILYDKKDYIIENLELFINNEYEKLEEVINNLIPKDDVYIDFYTISVNIKGRKICNINLLKKLIRSSIVQPLVTYTQSISLYIGNDYNYIDESEFNYLTSLSLLKSSYNRLIRDINETPEGELLGKSTLLLLSCVVSYYDYLNKNFSFNFNNINNNDYIL